MFRRKNKNQPTTRQPLRSQDRPGSSVFSYHASRSADHRNVGRHEMTEERQKRTWDFRYVPTWISVIVIGFSALYALTLGTNARVSVTQPTSQLSRDTGVYQAAANNILGNSIWSHSKLTINTEAVANQLQRQFPEIDTIAVSVPLIGRRPVITIQTAEPAFLLVSSKSGAYYVDNDGRVMVKAADIKKALPNVVIVRDESGVAVESNKQLLPKSTVAFITTVSQQLELKNVAVDSFELPSVPFEVRLKLQDKPYYVRFNTEAEGRVQAGTFLAIHAKLVGDRVTPKEYIDVRVDERAYYK